MPREAASNKANARGLSSRKAAISLLSTMVVALAGVPTESRAAYVGSASSVSSDSSVQSAATEILGSGGGPGPVLHKGGGHAGCARGAPAAAPCGGNPGN